MKRLLIDATGSSGWIGGVYHKKNILFSLLLNDRIRDNCSIYVAVNREHADLFAEFADRVRICPIQCRGVREHKIKIAYLAAIHRCDCIFPNIDIRICRTLHAVGINWIPDYQHCHYPEFFTETDMNDHRAADIMTVDSGYPLVLSSNACLDDFRTYISKTKENVYVVPFVSYIEKEVKALTDEYVAGVCAEYGVKPYEYIMTANQFWQHKNHAVIFEAVKKIASEDAVSGSPDATGTKYIFTGEVSDYRSDEYADRIREYLADPDIAAVCTCTGFIDRRKQLALMKGAKLLIQPSLFEGWGTVLEDAKVLDKTVILSDIPVHREQMNDKCFMFEPHDADELARLIVSTLNSTDPSADDVSRGIEIMYASALKYSDGFERMLKDISHKEG